VANLAHILLLEYVAWSLIVAAGPGAGWGAGACRAAWWVAVVLLVIAQAQAGWLQHDFGHLSVFKSRRLNLWAHRFVVIHLKAASSAWWNYRHYLHHAKPNISDADPDINMPYVFMMGERMAARWAKKQIDGKAPKGLPYDRQHQYW
jgi:fatty acid desaturase 2 (delta-6 desaturase)